jgi:hypothetical protein
MALFNRLLIIVLAVVVLVVAIVSLLATVGLVQPAQVGWAGSWIVDRLVPLAELDPTSRTVSVGVCLLLIVVAVLLLVLELRQGPRETRRITLKDDELGRVTVAMDGLRELANREAVQVAGVTRARSQVEEDSPGLRISCQVSVDPAISVPEMTASLRERLKAAVEHHVGLSVTQVSVDARVAPLASNQRHRRVE